MSEVAEAGMEKLAGSCHSQFPAGTGHMNPIIQQLMQPGMTTAQVTRVTLNDLHDQGSAMDHVPHTLSSCSPPTPTCPTIPLPHTDDAGPGCPAPGEVARCYLDGEGGWVPT